MSCIFAMVLQVIATRRRPWTGDLAATYRSRVPSILDAPVCREIRSA